MSRVFTKGRLIAILLCIVLIGTMLPVVASAASLKAPKMKKAVLVDSGVKVTWKGSSGAAGYRIYRRTSPKGAWKALADVTGKSYVDTKPVSGSVNYYAVRALKSNGKAGSKYSKNPVSIRVFKAPVKVKATTSSKGITITWKTVKGAPRYKIYRRSGTSKWKSIGTTTATSYLDNKANYGKEYDYRVRVVSADGKNALSPASKVVSATLTKTAKISSLTNKDGYILVKWPTIKGAAQYRLFRKTEDGDWFTVTTQTGNSYSDADVVNNVKYSYYVRCLDAAGEYKGVYDSKGKSITYYSSPTMVSCTHTGMSLLVKWEAVDGVGNYIVYRKIGSGSWMAVGESTTTSFTDTSMPSGTYCLYTVACADSSGNAISAYGVSTAGATSYMDSPVLLGITNVTSGVNISWRAVDKAPKYVVYRYVGDKIPKLTDWTKIDTVSSTSYTDTSATDNNRKYWYTVAASDGTEDLSPFDETGLTIYYYDPPTVVSATNEVGGVQVKWNKVDGASSYKIYRWTGNGAWTQIGTAGATSNTFTDGDVESTGHYWYSVASVAKNDSAYYTSTPGAKDTTYYGTPFLTVTNKENSIYVSWTKVDGVGTYRLEDGNGNVLYTGGGTSYTKTGVSSGTIYHFKVCSYEGGAKVSGWRTDKIKFLSKPVLKSASSGAKNQVTLTWTPVAGADHYEIWMKDYLGESWELINNTATGNTFTAKGLTSDSKKSFKIVAVSAGGSVSVDSNIVHTTVK